MLGPILHFALLSSPFCCFLRKKKQFLFVANGSIYIGALMSWNKIEYHEKHEDLLELLKIISKKFFLSFEEDTN